ncbi:MAG TPA: biotin/lipoyl-binding protein, partial [Opitutaceae bacterium]|nr:biotin/lipoyl-binding protein [Opitutaceae bacterium]
MKSTSIPDLLRPAALLAGLAAALLLPACSRNGAGRGDLVLSGNLEVSDAQLGFKAAGRLVERLVSEGDRVTAGQLVARLDDAEQRAQLALRQAELAAAEAVV